MYDVTALFLPFLSVIVFSQAYQYLYMPGDCWFYVTVQMFNIEKKRNTWRLFDVLPDFPFTTSETMHDYYL